MQWVILVPWNGFIGTIQQRKFNIKIVMSSNIQSQGDRLVDIERSVGGHRGLSLDFSRGSILGIISEGGGHEKSLTATSKSMPPERRDGINNKQNFNGNLLASADGSFNFCLIPVRSKDEQDTPDMPNCWGSLNRTVQPRKNWIVGLYLLTRGTFQFWIQETGRVGNGEVFSWWEYFLWSGAKFW